MPPITRRQLLQTAAAASLASQGNAAGTLPTRRLGKINFQASILGLGAQYLGDPGVEQAHVDRFIAEAVDNGLNYIDTAPTYGASEWRLGPALKGRRDKVFLVSKVETNAKGDAIYQIQDSLRKLQTDHLDCVLIHNVGRTDRYPDLKQVMAMDGTLGALLEARKKGLVKHIGLTSHLRPARALPVLETGEIELAMFSLNYVERHIYGFEEKVIPECRKRNIGVIAMKVLGGPTGKGAARLISPEDHAASLRYVWGIPGLAVAIVGMRNVKELRPALAAARAYKPLDQTGMTSITERGKLLAAQWGPLRGPVV
jgi:aryl-alcohol dehydrogenase-like predicted oxidoreductase